MNRVSNSNILKLSSINIASAARHHEYLEAGIERALGQWYRSLGWLKYFPDRLYNVGGPKVWGSMVVTGELVEVNNFR